MRLNRRDLADRIEMILLQAQTAALIEPGAAGGAGPIRVFTAELNQLLNELKEGLDS